MKVALNIITTNYNPKRFLGFKPCLLNSRDQNRDYFLLMSAQTYILPVDHLVLSSFHSYGLMASPEISAKA